ncbi:rhomboid family intramembrane serine protease [Candidatus Nitrosocosmicus franklandus]|uniref:Rhomboid protease GluP n=1 Tax=Candidatus Nitrosocosmicus franklandianus TaxID=1798806 RepID=A0A484I813_9ARCH|nr:rhomboid family intramembrane serine protease [Candidatus Nitrosocosmicus franklandus]VFJ13236.1 Rhomboid protease GluP [Candidatus Nitrosocosmicus franklandus]
MFPIHDDTPRVNGRPFVNYGLIGVNIIVFIYEIIITGNFSNRMAVYELYFNYGSVPDLVLSGQNLGSLFSSMFMHGSIAHLLGNMFFLYVFGDNLEDRFGHFRYLLLYLFWGVMAALAHSIYAISTGEGNVPAIGASGAISGVLGAYLIFFPHAKIHTIIFAFFITTVRIPAIAYIPFWFIMQLIFALIGQSGGVAYLAHIGGFIIGLVSAYGWKFFSTHLFDRGSYRNQDYRPRSIRTSKFPLNNHYVGNNRIDSSDVRNPKRILRPEIIMGENFVDVIYEDKNASTFSQIQANFNNETRLLTIHNLVTNRTNTLSVSELQDKRYVVSNISVINGIVRIRLAQVF